MQRRIVYGIAVALLAMSLTTAPAQSRSGVADSLEDQGFTILEEYSDGGVPSWRLRDSEGRRFSVSVMGRFTETHAQALEAMREVIHEIDGLEIDRLRYVFEPDRADAVVIPEEFIIGGEDYEEYLPSGMQFEFDDAVRFDFRILVDNLAVRMNGQFISEEQFLDRIQRAVANPGDYIQSQDPQFLAQQIVSLRARVDTREVVDADQNRRDQEIVTQIEELSTRTEESLQEVVDRGDQALQEVVDRGDQAVQRLETQIAELAEQQVQLMEQMVEMADEFADRLQTVQTEKAELEEQFEALRRGSIILASRTLFGSLRDVAPETILQVVQLRAADPGLSPDEAQEQVNADLPEDAETLHTKHVQAIYALYFNQYE